MNGQILLAKIAANPTETAWSQIYSTLNLAIVIELHKTEDSTEKLGLLGKKLLERLQREYFALDEKNLDAIKTAVTNSLIEVEEPSLCSIILATITNDGICYVVIAHDGFVTVKRQEALGEIARGEASSTHGFSGRLEHGDIVILQTSSFAQTISRDQLISSLRASNITDAAESLAPLLHNNSVGNEAAIFMQYNATSPRPEPTVLDTSHEDEIVSPPQDDPIPESRVNEPVIEQQKSQFFDKFHLPQSIPSFTLPPKKILFVGLLILLLVVLGVSLYSERQASQDTLSQNRLEQVVPPITKQIEEAEALVSVNKGIALEKFKTAKKTLEKERVNFTVDSEARKEIEGLISRIDTQLDTLAGNTTVKNKREVFSATKESFGEVGAITIKAGELIIADFSKGVLHIAKDSSTVETAVKKPVSLTADSAYIYILGTDKLARIEKNTKTVSSGEITDKDLSMIDTFNGNIYVLDQKKNDIIKKPEPDSSGSSYFKEKPTEDIVSFAIDGSVWIVDTTGSIEKFTKGVRESIPFSGLPDTLGTDLELYTQEGFINLYLLDKTNKKLLVIKKTGQFQNQYNLSEFDTLIDVAIDEKNATGYIATPIAVFSFDL